MDGRHPVARILGVLCDSKSTVPDKPSEGRQIEGIEEHTLVVTRGMADILRKHFCRIQNLEFLPLLFVT